MREDPFAIRREIGLKWRRDWRQHAPNTFAHIGFVLSSFIANIKPQTSDIKHQRVSAFFRHLRQRMDSLWRTS
jgi:hypothetical protein